MTPDQDDLIRKARESIRAARLLVDHGIVDAPVSLAYYAMFYLAEAFLLEDGLAFSKHSGVIGGFGQHFAKTERVPRRFHQYLTRAFQRRIEADYEPRSSLRKEDAIELLGQAEEFLDLAEQMLGPIPDAGEEAG